MASTVYTIDSNLKINGVNTSGNFSESNIPIIRNGSRCVRLRKGTPSSFTELIHKNTVYSGNVLTDVGFYVQIANFATYYECGFRFAYFDYWIYSMGSIDDYSGDIIGWQNIRTYQDQKITMQFVGDTRNSSYWPYTNRKHEVDISSATRSDGTRIINGGSARILFDNLSDIRIYLKNASDGRPLRNICQVKWPNGSYSGDVNSNYAYIGSTTSESWMGTTFRGNGRVNIWADDRPTTSASGTFREY